MTIDLGRNNLLGQPKQDKVSVFDVILIALIIVLLANVLAQFFWLSPVKVDGQSMMQTLQNEDWLYMDKLKEPKRGDVIVFKVSEDVNYIKRIIALPGESVKTENGFVYIKSKGSDNWVKLDEPYAYYQDGKKQGTYDPIKGTDVSEITLSENQIFVMGDNRWGSRDSREIGPIDIGSLLGVVPNWAIKNKEKYSGYLDFVEKVSRFFARNN